MIAWIAAIGFTAFGGFILLCAGVSTGEMHGHLDADRPDAAAEARSIALNGIVVGGALLAIAIAVRP